MRSVLTLLAVLSLLTAPPVSAQTIDELVIEQLELQGYQDIRQRRTLLGRIVVSGSRDGSRREVVVQPRTGEILRDYTRAPTPDSRDKGVFDRGPPDNDGRERAPPDARRPGNGPPPPPPGGGGHSRPDGNSGGPRPEAGPPGEFPSRQNPE